MTTILLGLQPEKVSSEHLGRIRALAPEAAVVVTKDRAEMEALLHEVEIAAGSVPYDLIVRAPALRWFQQWWAGADWLSDFPEAVRRPFVLTNASGVHAVPMSEHVLALMLGFSRGMSLSYGAQARREWAQEGQLRRVFELAGKTALVVGLGAVGSRTAQVLQALDMVVWGVRRTGGSDVGSATRVVGTSAWRELLPEADFVVLTLPHTNMTRHLVAEQELRRMKPTAYLINVGRGACVDEVALVQALREGWIAGAGLDVFETEPLPADSPLWDMRNVIVTAHYGGATPHGHERAMDIFLDNLRHYLEGEPLQNVVDKVAGY